MVRIINFNRPLQQIIVENNDGTNKLQLSFKEWKHLSDAYTELVGDKN